MGEVERHVAVTVVNRIQLVTFHELLHVVLHYWALGNCCVQCTCGSTLDAVSKCEDVVESLMLESVWVDIDKACAVSDACLDQFLMRETGWIDVGVVERSLDHFA